MVCEDEEEEEVTGGMKSKCAREKPPMSWSEMTLQSSIEEGSWKECRRYGLVCDLVASPVRARSMISTIHWQFTWRGSIPILDSRLNSSRLLPKKFFAWR